MEPGVTDDGDTYYSFNDEYPEGYGPGIYNTPAHCYDVRRIFTFIIANSLLCKLLYFDINVFNYNHLTGTI